MMKLEEHFGKPIPTPHSVLILARDMITMLGWVPEFHGQSEHGVSVYAAVLLSLNMHAPVKGKLQKALDDMLSHAVGSAVWPATSIKEWDHTPGHTTQDAIDMLGRALKELDDTLGYDYTGRDVPN